MSKKHVLLTVIIILSTSLAGMLAFALAKPQPVLAAPLAQQIASPTPDADGRITYIVQKEDTCLSIALRYLNGDINKIIELNKLSADCIIAEGQTLLLGIQEIPTSTKGPSPTPTTYVPSATPTPGTGTICAVLFNDINGNGMKDPEEFPMPGGAISITDREGIISLTGVTVIDADPGTSDEFEPVCFPDLPEGEYNISMGAPEGYNATTAMNYPLKLTAGDQSILDFGAQTSSAGALLAEHTPGTSRRSPVLAIMGGLLLLVGAGIAVYLWFQRR